MSDTRIALKEALLAKTRKGRVQDWIERIAAIAETAYFDTAQISWQGSPLLVASNAVEFAIRRNSTESLQQAIKTDKEG